MKTALLSGIVLCAGLAAATAWFGGSADQDSDPVGGLTSIVKQGQFVSSITEPGDVQSSSNVEIRCRVRERGGTPILKVVAEGTRVEAGDFLVQLDDSSFRDELVEQKIRVATDKASVIQAESDLNTATRGLQEFENGQFDQELATLEAELAFSQETLRRTRQYKQYSEKLARKGYVNKAQLEADRFAVIKAEQEVNLAQSKLTVFRDFTQERLKAELVAEIKKQEANLEASQYTLELSKQRLAYYEQQVASCHIVAPVAGQVVYANDVEGRGDSGIVIEEGVSVREGQILIQLPDPTNMQVVAKVNDSKINSVRSGQDVTIRLDTAPEVPIAGRVRKVADFPLPRRWSQAPIEYEVFIDVTEQNELVRTGLRAKAEVFVERIDNALMAPVSSIIEKGDSYFAVVAEGTERELRSITIGPNNESHVVIASGLQPGEHVLVDPDEFRQDATEVGDDDQT